MEEVLWYVLTGTRGGPNRARILRILNEQPRNANKIAETLNLDYKTVRHHLDVLVDNGVIVSSGDDYGSVYIPSQQVRHHWGTVDEIISTIDDVAPLDSDGGTDSEETRE